MSVAYAAPSSHISSQNIKIGSRIPFTILAIKRRYIARFASPWARKIALSPIASDITGIPNNTIRKYELASSSVIPEAHKSHKK